MTLKTDISREDLQGDPIKYDFSTIEWYGSDLSKLMQHLQEQIALISQHPERHAETLCRLLSRRLEIKENQLLVVDGSIGAIHLIARQARGAHSVVVRPTNMEILQALEQSEHQVKSIEPTGELGKLPLEGADYCWLSSPGIADGTLWSRKTLLSLLREHSDVTFVVDLSASSFVLESTLRPSDVAKYPNLITISSFSQRYNLPGLRVAYLAASETNIETLKRGYTPKCVSAIATEAIRFILIHPAQFTIPIRKWHRSSIELRTALDQIEGVSTWASATPYFVMELSEGKACDLKDFLQDTYGIRVGTAADNIDLAPNEVRITPLGNEANEALIKGVAKWIASQSSGTTEEPPTV